MKMTRKCQYALKAVFDLASRNADQPVKAAIIAGKQGISLRFLEIILNELKHGGFVESRRGSEGGYMLTRPPRQITVAEVIEYIEGPIFVAGANEKPAEAEMHFGDSAFAQLWHQVNNAVSQVCQNQTFADLVHYERAKNETLNYYI